MGSDDQQNTSESDSQTFTPRPSKSKKKSKATKKEKPEKGKKVPRNKKTKQQTKKGQSKSKETISKDEIYEYLYKMNRPYNLLNIFDNLHGAYKKPALQACLQELVSQKKLVSKQFGKNKLYFINQDKFEADATEIQSMSTKLCELRQQCGQLQEKNKQLSQQYRILSSKLTINELKEKIQTLRKVNKQLQAKKNRLVDGVGQKIDEKVVLNIEEQQKKLKKQINKRKKLTKQCLQIWGEILQKKVPEVAEMMGVDL